MTNEEAIINGVDFEETISEFELLFDEWHNKEFCTMTRIRDYAEYYKEENTKLKAEIEQLKEELEQSVIKCTHGYDKRQNEIGETLIYCEYTDNWMNVTLGDCLGNCEAEQSLKGEVSNE